MNVIWKIFFVKKKYDQIFVHNPTNLTMTRVQHPGVIQAFKLMRWSIQPGHQADGIRTFGTHFYPGDFHIKSWRFQIAIHVGKTAS